MTGISKVNTMAADDQAPCVASSSATMAALAYVVNGADMKQAITSTKLHKPNSSS